jgi:hypothetical protein
MIEVALHLIVHGIVADRILLTAGCQAQGRRIFFSLKLFYSTYLQVRKGLVSLEGNVQQMLTVTAQQIFQFGDNNKFRFCDKYWSLRRADHSSRGFLQSVACLCVIVKSRQ